VRCCKAVSDRDVAPRASMDGYTASLQRLTGYQAGTRRHRCQRAIRLLKPLNIRLQNPIFLTTQWQAWSLRPVDWGRVPEQGGRDFAGTPSIHPCRLWARHPCRLQPCETPNTRFLLNGGVTWAVPSEGFVQAGRWFMESLGDAALPFGGLLPL